MLLTKTLAMTIALFSSMAFTTSRGFAQEVNVPAQEVPSTRTVKIPILFLRAADVAEMFGGIVIRVSQERPGDQGKPYIARPGWNGFAISNLLPEGVQSVTALEIDNTILVRYDTDEALRDFKAIISMVDKKSRFVGITARTLLTFSDKKGSTQQVQVDAQGTTTDQRVLHLKSASNGTLARIAGAELVSVSSEANLLAWPNGDGTINLTVDWYLDTTWRVPGDSKPLKQHNVYRTDSFVKNGSKAAITHAKVSMPFGTTEVALELTPTLLDSPAAAAPTGSHTGK